MAKAKIYNLEGKQVGEQDLNPEIFGIKADPGLVHLATVVQSSNNRQVLAHTKDRSEVRGGGRKPWRQKGTGNARHGSNRSPIWIGGGVTFGPTTNRNFNKKINKQAKKKALFMALSDKVASDGLVLLEKLELPEIKTKKLAGISNSLPVGKKVLFILPEKDEKIIKSAKNIANVKTISADSLNIIDILENNSLVVPLASLEKIEKVYLKK